MGLDFVSLLCMDKMEEPPQLSQDHLKAEEVAGGGIHLELEVSVVGGVAVICLISFLLYLYLAKREEVPKEYFMKNKIPLIKKVRAVKIDIKKAKKEQEIY